MLPTITKREKLGSLFKALKKWGGWVWATIARMAWVLVIAAAVWYWDYREDWRVCGPEAKPYGLDQAKLAVEQMNSWAAWLVAVQTAALAALSGLFSFGSAKEEPIPVEQISPLKHTIIFLGASIFMASYVLGCLPSISLRLTKCVSRDNDIYEAPIFDFIAGAKIQLGLLTSLEHIYCLLGMCFLGKLVFLRVSHRKKPPAEELGCKHHPDPAVGISQ